MDPRAERRGALLVCVMEGSERGGAERGERWLGSKQEESTELIELQIAEYGWCLSPL